MPVGGGEQDSVFSIAGGQPGTVGGDLLWAEMVESGDGGMVVMGSSFGYSWKRTFANHGKGPY